MFKKISLIFCLACALFITACAKSDTTTNRQGVTNANENKAVTATTPASTTVAGGEKIGVPECDDFIAAYEACVSGKVPEAARAQYKAGIEQWRASWHKLAQNPTTKASLVAVCKQSAESARASMKTYGCTF
jgi:hypothetical protein